MRRSLDKLEDGDREHRQASYGAKSPNDRLMSKHRLFRGLEAADEFVPGAKRARLD